MLVLLAQRDMYSRGFRISFRIISVIKPSTTENKPCLKIVKIYFLPLQFFQTFARITTFGVNTCRDTVHARGTNKLSKLAQELVENVQVSIQSQYIYLPKTPQDDSARVWQCRIIVEQISASIQ